jgi:hypothetical protein
MKTGKNTGLRLFLVLLVCFTVISGCKEEKADNSLGSGGNDLKTTHELGTFPGLDAETERRILQAYLDTYFNDIPVYTVNDFRILNYYCGENNGVLAVRIGPKESTYHAYPHLAWKDGILYRMRDAYELGLLTEDDAKSMDEMYLKYGNFPGLDAETEKRIVQDLFNEHVANHSDDWYVKEGLRTVDDFGFEIYYGTYNGYVVIYWRYPIAAVIMNTVIDGIELSGAPIIAWKDGVFHDIKDLYEQGLLTREDILMIQTMQKQGKGGRL